MNAFRLLLATAALLLSSLAGADVIGLESFDYPDGPVGGRSGGQLWNYTSSAPTGHTGPGSTWDNVVSRPAVANGRLLTQLGSVRRTYNGTWENLGAVNDPLLSPSSVATSVYYRVTLVTGSAMSSEVNFGISSDEFGTEQVVFGKPAGQANFSITLPDSVIIASSIPVQPNTTYVLVTKIDYAADTVRLYINPDLSAPEPAVAAAAAAYTGTEWSTAVNLASGESSPMAWDDLVVATDWESLRPVVVTTTADEDNGVLGGGTGVSLREAVKYAPAGRIITFAPFLSGGTITLGLGEILIPQALNIDASGLPGGLTVDGNNATRHFQVPSQTSLSLRGLTLTRGNVTGASSNSVGGAIVNSGTLTLIQCTLSGNSARVIGGAICNYGSLRLTQCILSNNSARGGTDGGGHGGAIASSGPLTLSQCTLSRNSATGRGGAIFNSSHSTISESTLFDNSSALVGGAISNSGTLALTQCTLADNSTISQGGAIYNGSYNRLSLLHCTLSGNSAAQEGGAIYQGDGGNLTLTHSIVAGNLAPTGPEIWRFNNSTITPTGVNLIGDLAGSALVSSPTLLTGDPLLAPLGNYGGPTQTRPPMAGSPAIDAAGIASSFATDQRGRPRVVDGNANGLAQTDLGAVESPVRFVTIATDSTSEPAVGSLRRALTDAATSPGWEVVGFAPSLNGQTITLASQLIINDADGVAIAASSLPDGLTLSGNDTNRHFLVNSGKSLTLQNLTLTRGNGTGAGNNDRSGGAINNDRGTLTLVECTLSRNSSASDGGAILNLFATLNLIRCILSDNSTLGDGGAIDNDDGTVKLAQSTLSNNSASGSGGAIYGASGGTTVSQSTLSGNSAHGDGGAIYNVNAYLAITQSTLSSNSAIGSGGAGGAIANEDGTVALTQSTLSNNSASGSGGAGGAIANDGGMVTLTQSTLAENFATFTGGAILNTATGDLTLAQCTLTANFANANGGAITNDSGTVTLTQSTLAENSAALAGGAVFNSLGSNLTLANTIAAGNLAPTGPDIRQIIGGTITATGVNLIGDLAGSELTAGPSILVDRPKLSPLGDFGGLVQTMHPLVGSPAIDAAGLRDPITTNAGGTDARGFPRFVAGLTVGLTARLDVGAVEAGPAITVTNSSDGDVTNTLRKALANITSPGTRILFQPGPNFSGTITLSGTELSIPDGVSIFIDASNLTTPVTVSGNHQSRVFNIPANANLAIHSLRIIDGEAPSAGNGGGILNAGTLGLFSSALENSRATQGGAIFNHDAATLRLANCTLSGNFASTHGGAISNHTHSTLTLAQCTLAANSAALGGAIFGNTSGTLTLMQCTLSGNFASTNGGAIFNDGGTLKLNNTIAAGNRAPDGPDVWHVSGGAITPTGVNLIGNLAGSGLTASATVLIGNPRLAPLGQYGGPTATMPPRARSLAVDAAGTISPFFTDQRGRPRLVASDSGGLARIDLGAVESSFRFVTVASDTTSSPAAGSLRRALIDAAVAPGMDVIAFAPGLNGQTITLASQFIINDADGVTIDATTLPDGLTLSGNNTTRHFFLEFGKSLTLQGLTLTRGNGTGATTNNNFGGAINNNGGFLKLEECSFSGNSANVNGGAINNNGGTLALIRCTVSANFANNDGGAIRNSGVATVMQSTLFSNSAAGSGGAIANVNTLTLTHCTLSGNSAAASGGALFNGFASIMNLSHTIVAGNNAPTGPDVLPSSLPINPSGVNLIGNLAGSGLSASASVITGDPRLAPLGNYGGPTHTMALRPGSPARHAATSSTATTDQRGFPIVGLPDIGAYEAGNATALSANYLAYIWETLPATVTAAQTAATFDFDGDGTTNEAEWLAGTLATDANSAFRPEISRSGGSIVIAFPTASGRRYRLETSDALVPGSWHTTSLPAIIGNGTVQTFIVPLPPSSVPRRFYSVQVDR